MKIDMDFLKRLKDSFPNLIIIADGTQFCGAFEMDFETSGIDVLGASGYKWLLAGYGNGFMLFNEAIQSRVNLHTTGFNSAGINIEARNSFRFAKHFEPGHLDTLNFGSLNFAVEMLAQIGIENIEAHNKMLGETAKKELGALGLLDEVTTGRKEHSTIFNIKGNDRTFQHLADNNVICSQRGGGIRLSFHIYNSENDVDKIVEILKYGL
jgi:selenocysteine lyase/cysteine desulfurase